MDMRKTPEKEMQVKQSQKVKEDQKPMQHTLTVVS